MACQLPIPGAGRGQQRQREIPHVRAAFGIAWVCVAMTICSGSGKSWWTTVFGLADARLDRLMQLEPSGRGSATSPS
jgi:hypothetical protein